MTYVTLLFLFSSALNVLVGEGNGASTTELTPGDNSQFRPGDRYVWFPDGNDNPVLADLHEKVSSLQDERVGQNNQYFLYTRANRNAFVLEMGNDTLLHSSTFNPQKPTTILVHGWNNHFDSRFNNIIRNAFLEESDYNVIVVDWSHTSLGGYVIAVSRVANIGQHIAQFVGFLVSNGLRLYNLHIIGYSLGAHVAANAGRSLEGKVARITGLDPAGPLFWVNSNRLSNSDAEYVEVIHTDTLILGLAAPCGDVDFYPNGGNNQPGCSGSSCDHSRSYQFFEASVKYNHLLGWKCDSLNEAQSKSCSGPERMYMGSSQFFKFGSGVFYAETAATYPY